MQKQEIVIFRYRKGLRIGYYLETAQNKARLATEKDRAFTVPLENVIYGTGRIARGASDLRAFSREVEALAGAIDLAELWDVAKEDRAALKLEDIAELYWGGEASADQCVALLWHLHSDRCPYFAASGGGYVPESQSSVAERRERLLRQAREAAEEKSFLAWLDGAGGELTPPVMSSRQSAWLERLIDYVAGGDESPQSAWAKGFLERRRAGGDARRFAFDALVRCGVLDADENLDLRHLKVPVEFSQDELDEAAASSPAAENDDERRLERRDLRHLEVFSVDGELTTDIDDALSLTVTDRGYELGIHITDLSTVVRDGTALDRAARRRAVSFYFPETRIPMLPPSLSSGGASLLEGAERPVLSLLVRFNQRLELDGIDLVPGCVVNRHQLTYDQANDILGGTGHSLAETLLAIEKIAAACRRRRIEAGCVEIEKPDVEIRVDEARVVEIECKRPSAASRLVSELMILYNVEVARFCSARHLPFVYRAQPVSGSLPPMGPESGVYERFQFFKTVAPSYFSLEEEPHRLLGVELYAQVSSPLRRYIDLVAQRQVSHFLAEGKGLYSEEQLARIVHETGERLRELGRLEPARRRYWLLKYLEQRRSELFDAWVLEVRERECLIEVDPYGLRAPAIVPGSTNPGDRIQVEVAHIDCWDQHVRFRASSNPSSPEPSNPEP